MIIPALILGSLAVQQVAALTPEQWRNEIVYQVLTDRFGRTDNSTSASCNLGEYCGGTWQGIINHLDYIQDMGFTAIWISPIVQNIPQSTSDGAAYHGYWAQNIYEVNSNFGTADDLKSLSSALHNRGMHLMVDVVTNHMAYAGAGNSVDYSTLTPFNNQADYHPFCLIDYNNSTSIQVCWEGDNTVALADLRTEDSGIATTWNNWVKDLVSNYSIDGLRVDSAQQVDQAFFPDFQTAAGTYIVGEIFNGDPNYVCPYQKVMSGMLNYPAWYWVNKAFGSTTGSISTLVDGINTLKSTCSDTTLLGSFLENHDNVRFPSFQADMSLVKNAIAFTQLADGIPIIYNGQEQHFSGGDTPSNREAIWPSQYNQEAPLYTHIAALNAVRKQAIAQDSSYATYKAYPVYSDSATIVMRKGLIPLISVHSNLGASGSSYTLTLPSSDTGYSNSQTVIEVLSCTSYTTDGSGNLNVAMSGGLPMVFYPATNLAGSGICKSVTGNAPKPTTSISASPTTLKTTTSAACATPTSIALTFSEFVTTTYGQTIKLSGSVPQLGSWDTANAVTLSADKYTSSNPEWSGVVDGFTPGEVIEFKGINVGTDGALTWEADPNHTFTVPTGCVSTASVRATWQSVA